MLRRLEHLDDVVQLLDATLQRPGLLEVVGATTRHVLQLLTELLVVRQSSARVSGTCGAFFMCWE